MVKNVNREKISPEWGARKSDDKRPWRGIYEATRRYWRAVKNFKSKPKNKNKNRESIRVLEE